MATLALVIAWGFCELYMMPLLQFHICNFCLITSIRIQTGQKLLHAMPHAN